MDKLEHLQEQLQGFADERDWDQFHSPKNLSMALSVEASELVECLQWLTEEQSQNLSPRVTKGGRSCFVRLRQKAILDPRPDLPHNFVLVCQKCNNKKSDYLVLMPHYEKRHMQNIQRYALEIDNELSGYFSSNIQRSETIANWAYETEKSNNSKFWVGVDEYSEYHKLTDEALK
jgi:hypothetical protein